MLQKNINLSRFLEAAHMGGKRGEFREQKIRSKRRNFASICGFAKDGMSFIRSAIRKKKKRKKYSTRALRSGVRSQQVFVVSWRYTGGRPEMLGGPSSGEPAGERTTCRRDRWGQTAVHNLLPSSSPLLYSRSTRAQRSPTPFCPFLPAAWSSLPLPPPPFPRRHQDWLVRY